LELWKQTISVPLDALGLTLEFRMPLARERMAALGVRSDLLTEQAGVHDALPDASEFEAMGETEARIAGLRFQAALDKIDARYTLPILEQLRPLCIGGCDDLDGLFESDLLCKEAAAIWARCYFRGNGSAGEVAGGSSGLGSRLESGLDGGQEVQGLPDDMPGEDVA
jgi:hypothetical protein